MTDQELKIKYNNICNSISARRLKPAFNQLEKLILDNGLGDFHDEYRNLEETYRYMLKYTVEGVFDPERQKVYRKLIVSVFELADKVTETLRQRFSMSLEYEKKRQSMNSFVNNTEAFIKELQEFYLPEKRKSGNLNTIAEKKSSATNNASFEEGIKNQHYKIQRFFYHIWFSDKLSHEEAEQWHKLLLDPLLPIYYRAFITAAIMLSLQRFFDPEKFMLLFDAYDSDEVAINQRALVGLLINLYKYNSRLPYFPEITGRLNILTENPEFKRNIEQIITQFIRSKETEKLQQRIRDEILPEMIKISPHLKNKINLDSLMEEGLTEDKNPDWEDIFKDSPGFLQKMEEFSNLQMKGSDVFLGSFSMLKSFPFFNETSNWFMPFFPWNPEIVEMPGSNEQSIPDIMKSIDRAPLLCNSDKYSFCFSIGKIPKENLEFMAQAVKAEMNQLKDLIEDEELLEPGRKKEVISNQYIQDLYRFYKLFPRKSDFEDIFNWRLDFHNKLILSDVLKEDPVILRNIAEYYFAREHYSEAVEIFSYLLEKERDGELYQKIAWCHQKRGDFNKALDGYLKAELYEVNHLWNLKKIAICYRNLKQPDKALEYYEKVEKTDPGDLTNHLNIGHCLLELDKYEDALKCYFKVEYLSPGNKKVWRPIAWCSFLTGKKEQAEKYFLKLIEEEPNKHDFINMGHVQWSLGNRKAALDNYKKSISKEGFTEEEFMEVFEEDLPHLLNQGVDSDDIPIMLDQLRYFLEK